MPGGSTGTQQNVDLNGFAGGAAPENTASLIAQIKRLRGENKRAWRVASSERTMKKYMKVCLSFEQLKKRAERLDELVSIWKGKAGEWKELAEKRKGMFEGKSELEAEVDKLQEENRALRKSLNRHESTIIADSENEVEGMLDEEDNFNVSRSFSVLVASPLVLKPLYVSFYFTYPPQTNTLGPPNLQLSVRVPTFTVNASTASFSGPLTGQKRDCDTLLVGSIEQDVGQGSAKKHKKARTRRTASSDLVGASPSHFSHVCYSSRLNHVSICDQELVEPVMFDNLIRSRVTGLTFVSKMYQRPSLLSLFLTDAYDSFVLVRVYQTTSLGQNLQRCSFSRSSMHQQVKGVLSFSCALPRRNYNRRRRRISFRRSHANTTGQKCYSPRPGHQGHRHRYFDPRETKPAKCTYVSWRTRILFGGLGS